MSADGAPEPVPASLDGLLDPVWLTWALGARVVHVEQVGSTATLAQKIRFVATTEDASGEVHRHAYCVKGHFDGGPQTLLPEARFYRELRPVLDMRVPRAHYVGLDEHAGTALIVMDDVIAGGGRFLTADAGFEIETCGDSVTQLARLHAATWADTRWDREWLVPRVAAMHRLYPDGALQTLLDDGRAAGVPAALRDERRLRAALDRTAAMPATCVLHGDTHSNNVYLDADGHAGWVDWQVVQRGHWAVDVAYHLATTLEVEERRTHEADLLRRYLEALHAAGVDAPPWEEAWASYAAAFAHGYLLWAITRITSRDWVLINVPRLATAMADHDTYGRLGVG